MAAIDPAGEDAGDGFSTWTAMKTVTQETRASLVADIVGHPSGMPSVAELEWANPDVERSAIEEHLGKLRAAGIVDRAELPVGERKRDLPHVFYYVTDDARAFFDDNDIFDRETWRDQYAKLETPPEIERIESMSRPERE